MARPAGSSRVSITSFLLLLRHSLHHHVQTSCRTGDGVSKWWTVGMVVCWYDTTTEVTVKRGDSNPTTTNTRSACVEGVTPVVAVTYDSAWKNWPKFLMIRRLKSSGGIIIIRDNQQFWLRTTKILVLFVYLLLWGCVLLDHHHHHHHHHYYYYNYCCQMQQWNGEYRYKTY